MDFTRGKIYLDGHFRYHDSHSDCDKLLLVLNVNHRPPEPVVVAPAATNTTYRDLQHGCHPEFRFFHILKRIGFYHDGTLIQLKYVTYLDYAWFCKRITNNEVTTKDEYHTSKKEIEDIVACLKRIKEDVSPVIWKLI